MDGLIAFAAWICVKTITVAVVDKMLPQNLKPSTVGICKSKDYLIRTQGTALVRQVYRALLDSGVLFTGKLTQIKPSAKGTSVLRVGVRSEGEELGENRSREKLTW